MGGHLYVCPDCGEQHYQYHSCRNRHCPQCQHDAGQVWLAKQKALQLPVPYFLLTFTLPADLRPLALAHQRLFYHLLFRTSAEASQQLAQDPRFVGGQLGLLGILHTWGRNLSYHPHVHYLVPAVARLVDGRFRLLKHNEKGFIRLPSRIILVELSRSWGNTYGVSYKKGTSLMAKTTPSPATCPHYKRKKGRIKKKYRWFAHLAHRQKLSNKACLGREMVSRQGILTVKRRDKALSCFLSDADRWRTAVPFARTKAAHRLPTGRTPTNPHRGGGRRCGRGGRRDAHDQPQQQQMGEYSMAQAAVGWEMGKWWRRWWQKRPFASLLICSFVCIHFF